MLLEGGVTKEDLNHIINDIWNIFGDNKGKYLSYESFILLSLIQPSLWIYQSQSALLFTSLSGCGLFSTKCS